MNSPAPPNLIEARYHDEHHDGNKQNTAPPYAERGSGTGGVYRHHGADAPHRPAVAVLEVYPPWGEPIFDAGLNLLALSYRIVFAVVGGYLAARLAPRAPVGHALALGAVGLLLCLAGDFGATDMSPSWFLVGLVLIALPGAWLGGLLYQQRKPGPGITDTASNT